jgi:hypothetical protein
MASEALLCRPGHFLRSDQSGDWSLSLRCCGGAKSIAAGCTLREIADELASAGFMTGAGKPYAAAAIARMIDT